jgi:hypothetical protein
MKEANRNPKTHSLERLDIQDSRAARPTNRDVEVVKLPDGREFIRTPRTSLKRSGAVSDLPKKAGFKRRWVSSNIPNRIQNLIDLGYRPATDENGTEIAPIRGGTNKQGETFMRYALEISEEMDAQIERDNKQRIEDQNNEALEKMKNVDLGSGSSTYVKQDSQKLITRQN